MTAYSFAITSTETGALLGVGLLCFDARYASVLWKDGEGLERLHATAADWKEIGYEMSVGMAPGPMPTNGRIYMLMAGERAGYAIVQWVAGLSLDAERPELGAEKLDALLRSIRLGVAS